MLHRLLPLMCLGIGIFILVQVVMPVLSFKVWEFSVYNQEKMVLISPNTSEKNVLGVSIENTGSFPAFFSSRKRESEAPYDTFSLTIPSLKLEDLKVIVDSNDFEQNLAHLPGTALPGERGNVFVTGHSSLPSLFRPGNYKAIFAHLPEIKKGESVIVKAGGQEFEYIVKGLKIVEPSQVSVIDPPDQTGRYLSLMTCVPPGLYLKRLIVFTQLKGF